MSKLTSSSLAKSEGSSPIVEAILGHNHVDCQKSMVLQDHGRSFWPVINSGTKCGILGGINQALGVKRMMIDIYIYVCVCVCVCISREVVECRQAKVAGCLD